MFLFQKTPSYAGWLLCLLLLACDPSHRSQQAIDTTLVELDSTIIPDSVAVPLPLDSEKSTPDTLLPLKQEPKAPLFTQQFTGTIKGFESKMYSFSLSTPLKLSIQVTTPKASFKLYKKTKDLDETILREEERDWTGELDAGDYQLKIFLPLEEASHQKKETFQVHLQEK